MATATALPPLRHACPPSPAPGLWHLSPPATKFQPEAAAVETKQQASISFSVVTANVLALDPVDEGQQVLRSSRAARLDLQWHQNKIAVAGLQETRRPAGRSFLDHYVTFASGAFVTPTCPHHGCELWLHRDLPWLTYPYGRNIDFWSNDPCRCPCRCKAFDYQPSKGWHSGFVRCSSCPMPLNRPGRFTWRHSQVVERDYHHSRESQAGPTYLGLCRLECGHWHFTNSSFRLLWPWGWHWAGQDRRGGTSAVGVVCSIHFSLVSLRAS